MLPAAPRVAVGSARTAPGPALEPALERLTAGLARAGFEPRTQRGKSEPAGAGRAPDTAAQPAQPTVRLTLDPAALAAAGDNPTGPAARPQSYRLDIGEEGIDVTGADEAGLLYGVVTLLQWMRLHGTAAESPELPGLRVHDWPDVAHRGLLLDMSRDRVPTMETLYGLVDRLADWKINQLQLYMEHTFAYEGHETVWRDASPLTAAELRDLDLYCRRRAIELVPNQNSFGHFHRWLRHDEYRRLAECPEGVEHPFSDEVEPFSLCPVEPAVLELLADLYDQLLPQFTSRQFNVGLDETFDLGRGRSRYHCSLHGEGRVYLDFLLKVHQLVAARGRRMQFWGDVILKRPELIAELPRSAVALAWGYEAKHPFDQEAARFAASGLEFYLCPGTSSWNSFAGRLQNALLNLGRAARVAKRSGAAGYLITDWGDHGHLQPLPVSYPGLLAGAGFAWNAETAREPRELPIGELLDRHVWPGAGGITEALVELGDAYLELDTPNVNGSALFHLLVHPQETLAAKRYQGINAIGLGRVLERVERARQALEASNGGDRDDAPLERREVRWVAEMIALAAELGIERLVSGPLKPIPELRRRIRRRLRKRLEPLIAEHRELWLARSRAGGLEDSVGRLERLLGLLR